MQRRMEDLFKKDYVNVKFKVHLAN
jgi:hypothetical protein